MTSPAASDYAERIRADLACRECAAEVRVTIGSDYYRPYRARVIHAAGCDWLRRHEAREPGYYGAVPCSTQVVHRGPYKRDPGKAAREQPGFSRLMADACPACPPGSFPAVIPYTAPVEGASARARYKHDACGHEWSCWWDPESVSMWRHVPGSAGPSPLHRSPEPLASLLASWIAPLADLLAGADLEPI